MIERHEKVPEREVTESQAKYTSFPLHVNPWVNMTAPLKGLVKFGEQVSGIYRRRAALRALFHSFPTLRERIFPAVVLLVT